jgi:hypothetical protein
MTQQLVSPPDLAPSIPDHLTPAQCVTLWLDLLDASEAFLLAGFRRTCKTEEEVIAAYRQWNRERMEEHDEFMRRMADNLSRRGVRHGG